ncbi:MAG: substrate-binding domain-containing protein, partial [Candidatus Geothermarchaeales archaeon]
DSLSLEQLKGIYAGVITDWSDVGGTPGVIVAYGRQSNSGTYVFWKELVLGDSDYRSDMLHLNGNADIVEAVSQDPKGIAYVGMAYVAQRQGDIKILGVKTDESSEPVFPTLETILDGTYPISRVLYIYTYGIPQGAVRDYLRWILSHRGQEVVGEQGYVPIPPP